MKSLVKAALVAVALEIAGGPAQSQSLQITGTAGYLSEFELSGVLTESASSGGVEVFRAADLETCRIVQRERPAGKIRRNHASDVPIGESTQCRHLARGCSMCVFRRFFRPLERRHGLLRRERRSTFVLYKLMATQACGATAGPGNDLIGRVRAWYRAG